MQGTTAEVATRRLVRALEPRLTIFTTAGQQATAVELLDDAAQRSYPARQVRVFLVGPRPAGQTAQLRAWANNVSGRWQANDHYLNLDAPLLRYSQADRGARVQLLRASQWFGEDADTSTCELAWEQLAGELRGAFPGGVPLTTPGTTGRDLFLRSIAPGVAYPVLADDEQRWLRETMGQGRRQLLDAPADYPRPLDVHTFDGRLMYAALCWKLPAGRPRVVSNVEDLMARGFYTTRAVVPVDWSSRHDRIGLAPLREHASGPWTYPSEPRADFVTTVGGAELLVMARERWDHEVLLGMVWPDEARPLETWSRKLTTLWRFHDSRRRARGPRWRVHDALCTAYRAVILHTIGQFHGSPRIVTKTLPLSRSADVPRDARSLRVDGDAWVWEEHAPNAWPELSHPEWSSTIYSRARARLLSAPGGTGALAVPAETVVGFATDAVYLTQLVEWHADRNDIGTWRCKTRRRLGTWPASWRAVLGTEQLDVVA